MSDLMTAHNQWANRPDDERYWDLSALHLATLGQHQNRLRVEAQPERLKFHANPEDGLLLNIPGHPDQVFTDWSFRQIAGKLGAPAEYLQSLPAERAADLLNFHLSVEDNRRHFAKECVAHVSQGRVECLVSNKYGYIPNHKIVESLQGLESRGWIVPPGRPNGKTASNRTRRVGKEDIARWKKASVGWGLGEGDPISPSGLYLGDRNMFVFMVKGGGEIDVGTGQVLQRGAFFRNTEVGDGSAPPAVGGAEATSVVARAASASTAGETVMGDVGRQAAAADASATTRRRTAVCLDHASTRSSARCHARACPLESKRPSSIGPWSVTHASKSPCVSARCSTVSMPAIGSPAPYRPSGTSISSPRRATQGDGTKRSRYAKRMGASNAR